MDLTRLEARDFSKAALFTGQIDLYIKIWKYCPVYPISQFIKESDELIKSFQEILMQIENSKNIDKGQKDMVQELSDEIKKLNRIRYLISLIR